MFKKYEGEKRKQVLVAVGTVVAIVSGVYLWGKITGEEEPQRKVPRIKIKETERIEKAYERGYEVRAREIEKKLGQLLREINELKEENVRLKRELEKEREKGKEGSLPSSPSATPPPPPSGGGKGFIPPPPPPKKLPEGARQAQEQKETIQELRDLIGIIKGEERKVEVPDKGKKEGKKGGEPRVRIPKGSFVKAVLLSGVDAPAGGKAMGNPHPVLLRITDRAILPNRWKADIKECFVLGSAYGDLSSERAYIRVESLSCVKEGGEAVEVQVKGFVTGEDGKVGLRGRVVTRQGQILARTLIAGFLEGVAKAFQYTSTNLLISPQGAVSTINPDQAMQYGIVSGASEAAKKLADFYMKLANQMFPVIEINAGRKVDVVFLSEVKL